MVGDFGTTSDFQTQKKPPTLATFGITSDYRLSKFSRSPATMKKTQKSPGLEIFRHNRASVLVYN